MLVAVPLVVPLVLAVVVGAAAVGCVLVVGVVADAALRSAAVVVPP